jgi:uncharacterized protein YuzE
MKDRYLEVTYRKGKPFAAYFYLPRKPHAKSVRTERVSATILVDYGAEDEPIGVEITAPAQVTAAEINEILVRLGQALLAPEEFSPLVAA